MKSRREIDELILEILSAGAKMYPEVIPLLEGNAAMIEREGPEKFKKLPPDPTYVDRDEDWEDWEITQEDIDDALNAWDKLMPDQKGMLDAKVKAED